ncbi:MAG TPA: amidase [Candidatus Saccharimonadales bacterium]|nr:amidase [Candidatus Saccharimonadales bacterium]
MTNQHHFKTITEVSKLIQGRKLSPRDLVEECLNQIEKLNPKVNAFITVMAEQARNDAERAENEIKAGKWRGPLHGIPVAFKDMYDTAGIKTTAGFEYFKERVPQRDAAAVSALKEAGAIILGKTNMHKLAMGTTSADSAFGPVKNPWNEEYIAGGSSGGSAAAVASGMCFATVDTDAVGSTRLPAACCGVVGYKCTWGQLDNSGILEGEQADEVILKLATVGIITRSVSDTAVVADALGKTSYADKLDKSAPQRIGIVTNFGADETVREHFAAAVKVIEKAGFATTPTMAPFSENPDMKHIDESRKNVDEIFKEADMLLLPTTATAVPTFKNIGNDPQALSPQNTFFVNYFGLPAISVPAGFDANGLPLGLQIVGKPGDDVGVLQVAFVFQRATPWIERHPSS